MEFSYWTAGCNFGNIDLGILNVLVNNVWLLQAGVRGRTHERRDPTGKGKLPLFVHDYFGFIPFTFYVFSYKIFWRWYILCRITCLHSGLSFSRYFRRKTLFWNVHLFRLQSPDYFQWCNDSFYHKVLSSFFPPPKKKSFQLNTETNTIFEALFFVHVMDQSLSRLSSTVDEQVPSKLWPYRIHRQEIRKQVFLQVFRFYPPSIIPPMLRKHFCVTNAIQFRQITASVNNRQKNLRHVLEIFFFIRVTSTCHSVPGPPHSCHVNLS